MSKNKTADDIALWFISEYTRLPIDGPAYRALARRVAGALDRQRSITILRSHLDRMGVEGVLNRTMVELIIKELEGA